MTEERTYKNKKQRRNFKLITIIMPIIIGVMVPATVYIVKRAIGEGGMGLIPLILIGIFIWLLFFTVLFFNLQCFVPKEVKIGEDHVTWLWKKRKRVFFFKDISEILLPTKTHNFYVLRLKDNHFIRMGGIDNAISNKIIEAYEEWKNKNHQIIG